MENDKKNTDFISINELVFPHIYRVNASAGSGKTNALSDRFIKLLISKNVENNSIENIIAITFTNKAVMEMKDRILKKLKMLYFQNSKEYKEFISQISDEIGLRGEDLRRIVEPKIDRIIADYAHFQVKTIDSMISYISKISAGDMDLPPDFDMNFDIDQYLDYSVRKIINDITKGSDIHKKITNFIGFDIELNDRFTWQPAKLIKEGVKHYIDLQFTRGFEIKRSNVGFDDLNRIKRNIIAIAKDIKNIALRENITLSKNATDRINDIIEKNRITVNKPITLNYLVNGKYKYENLLGGLVEDLNNSFKPYFETLAVLGAERFVAFLELIEENINEYIRKKGVISLSDLTRRLKESLESGYVPEIFYKLGTTYYHYMVDEFQDTSRVQWDVIESLIENVIAENGSLFYVGDVKQAIYRFRGGDISLFSEIFEKNKGKVKCYETILNKNYRSAVEIVEFNNTVFSGQHLREFFSSGDSSTNFVSSESVIETYKDAVQIPFKTEKHGYVSVERHNEVGKILSEKVPETIKSVLDKGYSKKDICILVGKNKDGEDIANILMEKGYDVIFSKVAKVNENHLISEIVSFLKFLSNPMDKLSFFSFVSGEIFTKKSNIRVDDIYNFAFDNRDSNNIQKLFRDKYPEIWENEIEPFMLYLNYLPLYDIVTEIIKHFNVMENFIGSEAYLMKFLEIIKDMGEKGELSIEEILEKLKESEENINEKEKFDILIPEYIDAIKIMTVHKAKGLSFPVVIMPFTIFENSTRNKGKPYIEQTDEGMTFLKIKKEYTQFSNKLETLYSQERTRAFIDKFNMLYVAMTRAEDMMFIYTMREGKKRYFEDKFFFGDKNNNSIKIGEIPENKYKKDESGKNEKNYHPKTDVRWYHNLTFHGEDVIFDSLRREAISRGELFHAMLEEVETIDVKSMKSFIEKLSRKYGLDEDNIEQIFNFILSDSLLKELYTGNVGVYNEKEIVTGEDDVYRVDRLVFKDNKMYVIDYKTGEAYSEKHRAQIRRYMNILKEIYGKECVGILIYIDEQKRIVVDG